MNFLFGRIFWVIEIVQSCPATDHITFAGASCISYVEDGTNLDVFLPVYSVAVYILIKWQ